MFISPVFNGRRGGHVLDPSIRKPGGRTKDVNAGSTKDNGIYSNLRERQFVNILIFFTLFRVMNKRTIILVTQKTKEFNHK